MSLFGSNSLLEKGLLMRRAVFGTLTLDDEDECWTKSINVPSFAPFRTSPRAKGKPRSKFQLCIDASGDAEEPSREQVNAFQWFVDHQDAVCATVIDAIYRYYVHSRKENPDWFEMNDCPDIEQSDELRPLLELVGLRLRSDSYRKTALLGFSFECQWDEEHGLAVLIHKNTVVGIGQTELAHREPNADASIWLTLGSQKERQAARAILKALGAPTRATRQSPRTALLLAINAGDEKKARRLAEQGVDINDVPEGEDHPFLNAIRNGDLRAIKIMLDLGVHLQADAYGYTPVQTAIITLQLTGSAQKKMSPGPARDKIQDLHTRVTEVLRLLREAGAK